MRLMTTSSVLAAALPTAFPPLLDCELLEGRRLIQPYPMAIQASG